MADFKSKNNFWPAVFALVGTTIGAGIFGLPYVFSKTGFIAGLFEMIILVGIILLIQNIMRAFPFPDEKRESGFGSGSPGYKFIYQIAQGVKGDMTVLCLDPKSLSRKLLPKENKDQ